MANPVWAATIETKDKAVLSYATTINSAKLSFPLNDAGSLECDFLVDGEDTSAILTQLASGGVFIRMMRDGTTRFFGQLADMQLDIADDATVTTRWTDLAGTYDYMQQLDGSWPYRGQTVYLANPAVSSTPNDIVDILLGNTSGSSSWTAPDRKPLIKLTRSGSVTSPTRSLDMTNKTVLDCLVELGSLANSFDWYVTPDSTFTMASSLGSDKSGSVVLDLSDTNLQNTQSVTVKYLPPRNRVYLTGTDGNIRRVSSDATSITNYGAYDYLADGPKAGSSTEADITDSRLRASWRQIMEVTVEPAVGPQPWVDYYLGDRVALNVTRASFEYSGKQRINQIDVSFNDELVETGVKLTFEVI